MANSFYRFFQYKHYSFQELFGQILVLKSRYSNVNYEIRKDHRTIDIYISIKPTEESRSYKLRIVTKVESTIVKIYPVEPLIGLEVDGKAVPHMYADGSLCLYYPDYNEWDYSDFWADSLIPWASLWLYYYEIWLLTGEWLGGGIHGGNEEVQEA